MKREEAINFWKFRYENAKDYTDPHWEAQERREHREYVEALRMAIEALSKPNYESDTEVRLAVTDRNKDKVVLWDAFGEVEYYPHGDMYCPNCGARLVPENEYLEPTQTHGRLIDADASSKKLCETTIFIKDGEVFQRMINDATTVQADRPHGEWICKGDYAECSERGGSSGTQFDGVEPIPRITAFCPHCGVDMRKETE